MPNKTVESRRVAVENEVESEETTLTTMEMLRTYSSVMFPTTVSLIFLFVSQTITMGFVGHRLGFVKLAQFSVGMSIFNIVGAATGLCFSGNLDTLATQAIGRDPKQRSGELTFLFQQSFIFFAVGLVPITAIFYTAEPALAYIYGNELAVGAAEFLRMSPVYLMLIWTGNLLTRLLAAQSLAQLSFYANVTGAVGSYFISTNFILEGKSTITDAVFVLFLGQCVIVSALISAAWFHPEALVFPRKELVERSSVREEEKSSDANDCDDDDQVAVVSFSGRIALFFHPNFYRRLKHWEEWREFLFLGFYSSVSGAVVWWGFEALSLVVAQLGSAQVAGFTIIINIMCMYFSVCEGIAVGASTCIGNALGANKPHLAKRYMVLGCKIAICVSVCSASSIAFFGPKFYLWYTNDRIVLDLIQPLSYVHAWWHFLDIGQVFLSHGLYRAAGKQDVALKIIMVTLWLVGLPSSIFFGLKRAGGLLPDLAPSLGPIILGQSVGVTLMVAVLAKCTQRWDFGELALVASRNQSSEGVNSLSCEDLDRSYDASLTLDRCHQV